VVDRENPNSIMNFMTQKKDDGRQHRKDTKECGIGFYFEA
jgi:hypothetical protein